MLALRPRDDGARFSALDGASYYDLTGGEAGVRAATILLDSGPRTLQ